MLSVLAEVTRGKTVESRHYGHVAVTDAEGNLIAYAGSPEITAYMRSAAKPLQALNVITSGAAERFDFTEKELAIMCASHYGEDMHREVINGILDKLNLPIESLLCGSPLSTSIEYQREQLINHHKLLPSNSDCSGKHCGFLSVCLLKGYSTENYNKLEHPMQQEVLQILSDFTSVPTSEIEIGVDGCGVPVHALPLKNIALGYAKFSSPDFALDKYKNACERLFKAANAHPEMIAGTNGFCTEFLRATNGRFIGKLGAESIYCIGVKDKNLGIAVKIDDGNTRALYPVVVSVLNQLALLSESENNKLKQFARIDVLNNLGAAVGEIRPTVELEFVS